MKTIQIIELYSADNERVLIIPDAKEGEQYRAFYKEDSESGNLDFCFGTFVDSDEAAVELALANIE